MSDAPQQTIRKNLQLIVTDNSVIQEMLGECLAALDEIDTSENLHQWFADAMTSFGKQLRADIARDVEMIIAGRVPGAMP